MSDPALSEPTQATRHPARDAVFDQLHARYFNDLRGFLRRRIADRDVADDIAQETFFRVFRARGSFDGSRPAWPWLITIARNLMINRLRDDRRRLMHVAGHIDLEDLEDQADDRISTQPEDSYSANEHRAVIRHALAALPERHRRMLLLRAVSGLTYQEIAEHEGVTVDASKSLVKRARRRFRAAYSEAVAERGLATTVPPISPAEG